MDKLDRLLEQYIHHYWVDEDNWYSCPKAPDGCSDKSQGTECICNRDRKIQELHSQIVELFVGELPKELKTKEEYHHEIGHPKHIIVYDQNAIGFNSCLATIREKWKL